MDATLVPEGTQRSRGTLSTLIRAALAGPAGGAWMDSVAGKTSNPKIGKRLPVAHMARRPAGASPD
jgi:hypothetical protein